jgi:hypothetical protein
MKTKILIASLLISLNAVGQIPTNDLFAYYPFNGNANDASGNGLNGTVNGATLTTDRFGNVGSAYSFDGVGNHIQVNMPQTVLSKCTFSSWFKLNGNQITGQYYIIDGRTGWFEGSHSYLNVDRDLIQTLGYNYSTTIINDNNWHNIITTYDGNISTIYLDGNEISQESVGNLSIAFTNMKIGTSCYNNENFNGYIDDIRIYNRTLNLTEITALYNENKVTTNILSTSCELTNNLLIKNNQINFKKLNCITYVSIYDLKGNLLISKKIKNQNDVIDITLLIRGIYLIKSIDDLSTNTTKIIKE